MNVPQGKASYLNDMHHLFIAEMLLLYFSIIEVLLQCTLSLGDDELIAEIVSAQVLFLAMIHLLDGYKILGIEGFSFSKPCD